MKGSCQQKVVLEVSLNTKDTITYADGEYQSLTYSGYWSDLIATDMDGIVLSYQAYRLDFRVPSEHTFDGTRYEGELQILHKLKPELEGKTSQQYGIISFFLSVDSSISSSFMDQFLLDTTTKTEFTINLFSQLNS